MKMTWVITCVGVEMNDYNHVLAGPSQFEFKDVVKHNTGRLWPVKNERELNTIS